MDAQDRDGKVKARSRGWYGLVYFAPEDHRTLVPKQFGWGWTLNFARPWSLAVLLVAIFLPPAILAVVVYLAR